MNKIVKSGGHCYDSMGWETCEYWQFDEKTNSKCSLFNTEKYKSESLVICNKVYGQNYKGIV